jgi:hypothetical protein
MIMLRAVTNRDFPELQKALKALFNMELDYDPSIKVNGHNAVVRIARAHLSKDPLGRIRIFFVDTDDLSFGWRDNVDLTGFNIPYKKLTFIAVPETLDVVDEDCIKPNTLEGYLLAITLHEMYELLTGDFGHCDNPRRCINSNCGIYVVGTCSACLGSMIDEKLPGLTLEDLYCEEHLANLRAALKKWDH